MFKFDTSQLQAVVKQTTDGLVKALDESTLRSIGAGGAAIFRDEAIRNAGSHAKTGALQRNIVVKRLVEESNGTRQAYLVTVRSGRSAAGNGAFYWRFLEFGTAHSPAYPFLRPAYESQKQRVLDTMAAALAAKIKENMGGS